MGQGDSLGSSAADRRFFWRVIEYAGALIGLTSNGGIRHEPSGRCLQYEPWAALIQTHKRKEHYYEKNNP